MVARRRKSHRNHSRYLSGRCFSPFKAGKESNPVSDIRIPDISRRRTED